MKGKASTKAAKARVAQRIDDRSTISPYPEDMKVIEDVARRLHAASNLEAVRRGMRSIQMFLEHIENGCDIVVCKKGQADHAIWFL